MAPGKKDTTAVDVPAMKVRIESTEDFPPLGGEAGEREKSPKQKMNEAHWQKQVMLDMDFAEKIAVK
jgi:hypothetical protein